MLLVDEGEAGSRRGGPASGRGKKQMCRMVQREGLPQG